MYVMARTSLQCTCAQPTPAHPAHPALCLGGTRHRSGEESPGVTARAQLGGRDALGDPGGPQGTRGSGQWSGPAPRDGCEARSRARNGLGEWRGSTMHVNQAHSSICTGAAPHKSMHTPSFRLPIVSCHPDETEYKENTMN